MVVITGGVKPVVVVTLNQRTNISANKLDHQVSTYQVPILPDGQVIDTNGAGDAFVGGFLGQLVRGGTDSSNLDQCVRTAIHCASLAVQVSGCQPNAFGPFDQSFSNPLD